MTVQQDIIDAEVRHNVYLLRYGSSVYKRQSKLLDETLSDLITKLNARAPDDSSLTAARLNAMISAIDEQSSDLFKAVAADVDGDLKQLAAYEAKFHADVINGAYPIELALLTPTGAQVYSAAMSRPFQGKILRDWWKDQAYGTRAAYKAAVRLGYVEGETLSQIARRLRGVGDMNKRRTEAIVRTAINHMGQVARNKTIQANADLFQGEEWVSTLDGRTSGVCRARDGKVYPIGKGPQTPAHLNCRSLRVPKVKSWGQLGFKETDELSRRRFVADKRKVSDIPKPERDKLVGITTEKTYNDWLRTQPREFVEDVLGKGKAKLYLDKKLSLDKFIDREGKELTLTELQEKF